MASEWEAVECSVQYSGVGLAFVLVAAAGGCALAVFLPLADALRAALVASVAAMSAHACRELLRPRALRLRLGERIDVKLDDAWVAGTVRPGSCVLPWLTIVRWRPAGAWRDRSLLLLPGSAPRDDLRKIRVILRWG